MLAYCTAVDQIFYSGWSDILLRMHGYFTKNHGSFKGIFETDHRSIRGHRPCRRGGPGPGHEEQKKKRLDQVGRKIGIVQNK